MAGAYTRKYTVTNNGEVTSSGPVTLSLTSNSSSDFAVADGSCGPIAPNDSCMLSVRYTPATTGSDTAGLLFSNNGTQFLSSELSGTGVLPAEFTITAEEGLDFGRLVPGEVVSRYVVVKNTGGVTAGFMSVQLQSDDSFISITSNSCEGINFTAGRECQLTLEMAVPDTFTGSDVSTLADVVISPDNYVRNLGPITLTGTATTTI